MMNCRRFQNRLHEYVEGTLSSGTQAAADRHLVRCAACRQTVSEEQQLAQILSERLRQGTETLALHTQILRRILTALESSPAADGESVVCFWNRFARPVGIGVSLLLIATFLLINFFSGTKDPETKIVRSDIHSAVSIEVSYRVPTYKFRKEGNLVVDTLSYETIVASGTLWAGSPERAQEK